MVIVVANAGGPIDSLTLRSLSPAQSGDFFYSQSTSESREGPATHHRSG
jgi:hypothetical protein